MLLTGFSTHEYKAPTCYHLRGRFYLIFTGKNILFFFFYMFILNWTVNDSFILFQKLSSIENYKSLLIDISIEGR